MSSLNRTRKVCVVVASRANYGRVKYLMKAIDAHPQLELQLIVGASTLLERFGKAVDVIKSDGFVPDASIFYVVEGENLETQAKSTGLGIIELSTAFSSLKPDMVVTVADRYETMATAIAASYLNIPLIHLQGGEVSGNIDDKVRHAITKMSDYHFVATEQSRERVIRMGEEAHRVFNYGCPAMDVVRNTEKNVSNEVMSGYGGVGDTINWHLPYILMIQHPVTTEIGSGLEQVSATLSALNKIQGVQKVVLWPNADAGSDEVSKGIRVFREQNKGNGFHFYKNFSPEDFIKVMAGAKCCVGNSSSFLREAAFLGVPTVLVGNRQTDREHGANVMFANYEEHEIRAMVLKQLGENHKPDFRFGDGTAGENIANELTIIDLESHKRPTY